jgi:hypothetical protein
MVFIEPRSGEDSTEVYLRGDICDDCAVIHWAWVDEGARYDDVDDDAV